MIDVRRLRVLHKLAEVGSFSGTAKALGYTQSAISQQIAALERETELQLVERGRRPTALTDAGQTLLVTAEPIFGHLARAEAAVEELAGARVRHARVAAFPTACATFLPAAIAAVREAQRQTEISLVEAEPRDAARALKAGKIDLAVGYTYPGLDGQIDRALEYTALFDDDFRLVLPHGHRLLRRRTVSLSALSTEPWVVPPADGPSRDYRTMLATACRAAGFEPRITLEIEDVRAGQALVAAGLGVGLMPRLAIEPMQAGVDTRDLTPAPPPRRIVATRLAGLEPIAATRAMLRAIEAAAGSLHSVQRKVG